MTIPLPHLSYSTRNLLGECPKKFQLRKIVGVPERPMWAGVGGSAVHSATEEIDKAAFAQDNQETFYGFDLSALRPGERVGDQGSPEVGRETVLDLSDLQGASVEEIFVGHLNDEIAETAKRNEAYPTETWTATGQPTKAWPGKRNLDWWVHFGPLMVAAYCNWRIESRWGIPEVPARSDDPWPSPAPAIELKVNAEMGFPTKGYIDRVFQADGGDLIIADLKTGTAKSSDIQLGEYAAQIEKIWGFRIKWGVFIQFPVSGDEVTCKVSSPLDLSRWTPAYFEHVNQAAVKQIELGVFPPRVTTSCDWCVVRDFCAIQGGEQAADYDPLFQLLNQGEPA